jgi:mRNA-degrading endonuclease RelE of RelBE toxin-antitoxin system
MNYNIKTLSNFDKEVKKLAKKYPSLKDDLLTLAQDLLTNPTQGDNLGQNFYKVRMAISSKSKGKSGGARIITCFKVIESTIYLTSIYDKSEKTTISKREIASFIAEIDLLND